MSLRWTAALAAFGLVIAASAGEKKKLDYAPETGPEPRQVTPPCGVTLPSPHYLDGNPPQYFPHEPHLPPNDLSDKEPAACPSCTAARPAERQVLKSYAVADLVIAPPMAGGPPAGMPKTLEADLVKRLTAVVEPKSWACAGGKGTVEYFPLGMALVVNTTPTVHAAIDKYLDGLRQIQDTQFQIEMVVVKVNDAGLEKLGLARDFGPTGKAGEVRTKVKFLSADEVKGLNLHDPACVGLTAPTLTVLNGQKGCVHAGEVEHFLTGVNVQVVEGQLVWTPKNEPHELGLSIEVQPWLSADQRLVKLSLSARCREVLIRPVPTIPLTVPIKPVDSSGKQAPEVPFTQFLQDPRIVTRSVDETVTVPDGGTVVFYGGPATTEETVRETAPMFADLPFLQDLMVRDKKVTGTNHLLVFATPRMVKPTGCDECVQCAGGTGRLVKLMAEYSRACRDGNPDEARRLAMECLVLDPTCFAKK